MRKTIIMLSTFLILSSLHGQDFKRNIIKWNYSSIIFNYINLGDEFVFNKYLSAQIQGVLVNPSDFFSLGYKGGGFMAEMRYYIKGSSPKGFFIAPFFRYQSLSKPISVTLGNQWSYPYSTTASVKASGLGLCVGGQWIFWKHITLDVYGGPGYNFYKSTTYSPNYSNMTEFYDLPMYPLAGFTFRLGSTIGIAF